MKVKRQSFDTWLRPHLARIGVNLRLGEPALMRSAYNAGRRHERLAQHIRVYGTTGRKKAEVK